jgi:hypothetical protein
MASHKPASLPTNFSNSGWHMLDTLNYPTHLAFGNTLHGPFSSTCAWITLASNIFVMNTSITSLLPFRWRRMKLLKIGKAISIVVSLLHGTTIKNYVNIAMPAYMTKQLLRYGYPHPTKLQHCPYNPNPIKYGQDNQATDQLTPVPNSMKQTKNAFNKLLEASCTRQVLLIPPSSWHYLLLLANKLHLLKTCTTASTNSLTKWPLILMPKYNIALLTWYSMCTPMPHILVHLMREATWVATSSLAVPRDGSPIQINSAVHLTCTILKLAAFAAEAELGALFLNAQEAKVM